MLHSEVIYPEWNETLMESEIACGPRIGLDNAASNELLPYRFWIKNAKWVRKIPSKLEFVFFVFFDNIEI